ncbi:MarR family winged helix-turn-helix transcriptional regulator [Phyllobacterium myrsinacearum]|uniref:DNA-binding MarR family transcriptional regulator n=1 Tax=Phyllobacterium myrsinacearum TaxID=28101 RepID=A0A839EKH2_9HYPH|nr:MarR family winged helix-turn-helix transcriptional regulator [Phyllobacterium myrsinacearum]MBA8880933.1 DNA-binding MarR family transcriptional regulator [Phyllobacterium myrsinacearum]
MSNHPDSHHARSNLLEFAKETNRAQRCYENFLQSELTRCGIFNLAPAHFQILVAITEAGSTVKNLMANSGVHGSNLSYYLKHLEKYDYILRANARDDQRYVFIKQTKKAKALIADLSRDASRRVEAAWNELEDKNALHDVLVKISLGLATITPPRRT